VVRSPWGDGLAIALLAARRCEMDALELLKQDHAKVKELLEQAEGAEQGKE
jgi:hypothetical protein